MLKCHSTLLSTIVFSYSATPQNAKWLSGLYIYHGGGDLHHLDGSADHIGRSFLAFRSLRHALALLNVALPDVSGGIERVSWSVGIAPLDITL